MRILLLLFLIPLFAGCNVNQSDDGTEDLFLENTLIFQDTLTLRMKDQLFNYDHNLELSFDTIDHDSRCPIGVACVVSGNVNVDFTFIQESDSSTFTLGNGFGSSYADTIIFKDIRIYLIAVLPYPIGLEVIEPHEYEISILVNEK